ncbi:MAG: PQQ-binding-like beta-propeller repeat protein [Steroidobacteraceae bacterium]
MTLCQTQQFIANTTAGTTVVWQVDGVTGGSSSVGTVTTAGLYTPPSTPGTHVVSAVSSNNSSFSAQAAIAVTDLAGVTTYHNDAARTGQNLQEYALTPSTVSSGQFGKRWSCAVDGAVYAQPLYMANLAIAGGVHNVLFVATAKDSVYAFNADDPGCSTYWQISFTNPANGVTNSTQGSSCQNMAEYGVTPTPVIDPVAGTMYVLAATTENGTFVQRLHALNLATGADRTSPMQIQATVAGSPGNQLTDSFDASIENPRPAMVLSGGNVFMGWSSFCDNYPWQGWFISYNATTLNQTAVFNATPNAELGGIWLSAGAPAVDSSGNIYLSTGNGAFDDTSNLLPPVAPNNDFGMSMLNLNPSTLVVQDFFTPAQNAPWSTLDYDISAAGIVVLPDGSGPSAHPNLLIGGDKQGHLYVIDRASMGEFSSTNNVVQMLTLPNILSSCFTTANNGECLYSTPSFYNGTVYVGSIFGPLLALPLTNGLLPASGSNSVLPASQSAESYGFPNPTATISASPSGGGIVWVLDNSDCGTDDCANAGNPAGPSILRAYDATNLGNTLYSSSTLAADQGGLAIKFTVPVVANGHVYIGGSGMVTVYGLAP